MNTNLLRCLGALVGAAILQRTREIHRHGVMTKFNVVK